MTLRVKQESCNHEVMKHEDENYTQDGHAKREKALFLISKRPVSVLNSQTFGFFVFEHYKCLISLSYCRQFSVNLRRKEECNL